MTKIYGIKNCDAVKKARTWLKNHDVAYEFHNYKKDGVDRAVLEEAFEKHGWEAVINRRGTTWHQLPDKVKKAMTLDLARKNALENPSLIKRPLLVLDGQIYLGFKEDIYNDIFINKD